MSDSTKYRESGKSARRSWFGAISIVAGLGACAAAPWAEATELNVRTFSLNAWSVVGITSDYQLVGISCGLFWSDLVLPSEADGVLRLAANTYDATGRTPARERAPYKRLSGKAAKVLCSGQTHPAQVTLDVGGEKADVRAIKNLEISEWAADAQPFETRLQTYRVGENILGVTLDRRIVGIDCEREEFIFPMKDGNLNFARPEFTSAPLNARRVKIGAQSAHLICEEQNADFVVAYDKVKVELVDRPRSVDAGTLKDLFR